MAFILLTSLVWSTIVVVVMIMIIAFNATVNAVMVYL